MILTYRDWNKWKGRWNVVLWWFGVFQQEEKINRISVESRVRKDRESNWALHPQTSVLATLATFLLNFLCFFSLPRAEERLLVHVQPGAVPGILLDLCQHDGSTLHSRSRFVLLMCLKFFVVACCLWIMYICAMKHLLSCTQVHMTLLGSNRVPSLINKLHLCTDSYSLIPDSAFWAVSETQL